MNAPHISIIIPVYNRESLVCETLDSILAQTFDDWECLVVDDHSTDDSIKVVQKYAEKDPRVKLLVRPDDRPKGACACRNFGFENSKGKLVYFFDSDDLISPQLLETLDRKMNENPQAEYGVFQLERFTEDRNSPYQTSRPFRVKNGPLFHQLVSTRTQITTQNAIWRRELLDKALIVDQLWNETLPCGQESDLYCRLIGIADEGTWLDFPIMVHIRAHPESIGGRFSKTPKLVELVFQYRASLYDFYTKIGKMTPELHTVLMWSLLRFQAICVVLRGNRTVSRKFFKEIYARNKWTPRDLTILFLSMTLLMMGPLFFVTTYVLGKMGVPIFKNIHIRDKKCRRSEPQCHPTC